MKKAMICIMLTLSMLLPAFGAAAENEKNEETENLALGRPYTVETDVANGGSYAERDADDGVKLTDGKYGRNSWSDPAFVKYYRAIGRTVKIDLGENCVIDNVKARFISDNPAGVLMPEKVTVFVSSDGVNYSAADIKSGNTAPYGTHEKKPCAIITYDMPVEPICGRYVAMHFEVVVNTFIDEIEVYGKKDASALPPTTFDDIIPPSKEKYLDRDALGNDKDIILFHTGYYPKDETLVNNKKETFLPFIAYLDQSGNIVDTMFDSVMFLTIQGLCPSGGGLSASGGTTVLSDWQMVLNQYFSDTYNLCALDDAAKEVKDALGLDDYKISIYLTCPYPKTSGKIFGDYNGDGVAEKISTYDDCLAVTEWFVDECIKQFAENKYEHLVFKGFFFNSEGITGERYPYEMQYAKDFCSLLHSKDLLCVMIPYFDGKGIDRHEDIGFDAVLMQPNVSFDAGLQDDPAGAMADFDQTAKQFGLGIEMEIDSGIIWNFDKPAEYYTEYLHSASNTGLMTDTVHAYYNGAGDAVFGRAARSHDSKMRWLYDATYKFIKGTLVLPDDPFSAEAVDELEVESMRSVKGWTGLAGDWQGTVKVKTRPSHGRVTFASDAKTFTYTAKDYVGDDVIEYEITANGVTVSRTVKVKLIAKAEEVSEEPSEDVSEPASEPASEDVSEAESKKDGFPAWGYAAIAAGIIAAAAACAAIIKRKKKK